MAKVIPLRNPSPQTCADFVPSVDRSLTTPESFQFGLTAQIARRSVRVLLEEQGFKIQQILSSIDQHEGNVDRKFVERVAELIRRVIKTSPSELPSVRQLAEEQWTIHAGNVYSEYMQLSQQLFQDGINWGRLVAYVGFTSTYCLYAMQRGIQESIVESVAAWMVQVLGRDHVDWFNQHSWDEFVKYSERLIQERPRPGGVDRGGRGWGLAAVGAVGVGAVIAFAISNALS